MDITFTTTPKLEALRREVRAWLDEELPPEYEGFQWDFEEDPERWAFYRQFWKKQGAKRWLEPTWPREYGGAEMSRARGARRAGGVRPPARGRLRRDRHAGGPGDPASRHRRAEGGVPARHGGGRDHVGRGLHRAELGLRPGVAAHACRARRRRVGDQRPEDVLHRGSPLQLDHHRGAHRSRRAKRHKGISYFLAPMDSPGIELRPLDNIADGRQNLVFLDDLRVPGEPHARRPQPGLAAGVVRDRRQPDPDVRRRRPRPGGGVRARNRPARRGCSTSWCSTAARRRASGTLLSRRPRRPHAARRPRDRRRGREDAAVRGRVRVRHAPAPGDHQGVPTRVRADVHGDPRPAGPDPVG